MADICQEGHSLTSAPQRRHTACLRQRFWGTLRNLRGWVGGGDKMLHVPGTVRSPSTWLPELCRPGKGAKCRPSQVCAFVEYPRPEPEQLRPGRSKKPRACFGQFPYRATWSLSSVEREGTGAASWGKPCVVRTLRALPTHSSAICFQSSSLPTAQPT